jgi:hypothetical protein
MAARIRPSSRQKSARAVAEAIARETHTSVEDVQKLYEAELNELAHDAKITQYLGVLASRRVREKLKKH